MLNVKVTSVCIALFSPDVRREHYASNQWIHFSVPCILTST